MYPRKTWYRILRHLDVNSLDFRICTWMWVCFKTRSAVWMFRHENPSLRCHRRGVRRVPKTFPGSDCTVSITGTWRHLCLRRWPPREEYSCRACDPGTVEVRRGEKWRSTPEGWRADCETKARTWGSHKIREWRIQNRQTPLPSIGVQGRREDVHDLLRLQKDPSLTHREGVHWVTFVKPTLHFTLTFDWRRYKFIKTVSPFLYSFHKFCPVLGPWGRQKGRGGRRRYLWQVVRQHSVGDFRRV